MTSRAGNNDPEGTKSGEEKRNESPKERFLQGKIFPYQVGNRKRQRGDEIYPEQRAQCDGIHEFIV